MTTPVSFEIAKLLKEKGFDEICFVSWWWDEPNKLAQIYPHWESRMSAPKNSIIANSKKGLISAPTTAEVVMWLYEKYQHWLQVEAKGGQFTWKNVSVGKKFGKIAGGWANTPTEAYEAAIKYTLENLINE